MSSNEELKQLVEQAEKEAKDYEERKKLLLRLKKAKEIQNKDNLIPQIWNKVKKELNL